MKKQISEEQWIDLRTCEFGDTPNPEYKDLKDCKCEQIPEIKRASSVRWKRIKQLEQQNKIYKEALEKINKLKTIRNVYDPAWEEGWNDAVEGVQNVCAVALNQAEELPQELKKNKNPLVIKVCRI